jgi:hypothetical protein
MCFASKSKNPAPLVRVSIKSEILAGLEEETVGGYNALLNRQKQDQEPSKLTTVLFNHEYQLLHNRVELQEAEPISKKEYQAKGNIALLDAIGLSIKNLIPMAKLDV